MIPQATFTTHAFFRTRARLSLVQSEVASILDSDRVVLIGREKGSFRLHRLFYSQPDNFCFVAIQDEETGEVVTIVPVDYRKAFEVSIEATEMARELIMGPRVSAQVRRSSCVTTAYDIAICFKLEFSRDGKDETPLSGVYVLRVRETPREKTDSEFFDLLNTQEIREWFQKKISNRIPSGASDIRLFVRFRGPRTLFQSPVRVQRNQWISIPLSLKESP